MILNQIRRKLAQDVRWLATRPLHSSNTIYSAQQSPLFKLRQKTGLAYNLCREALNKHENNVDEAEIWLKAQALALGLQKATKVRGRNAREGLIGLAMGEDNKAVSIIELNCETDFVSKNQIFKDFAIDITRQFAETRQSCETFNIQDQTFVHQLKPTTEQLGAIDEQIVPLITKLGENIKLNRAIHYQISGDDIQLFGQVHAQAGKATSGQFNMMTGRFAAIVALQQLNQTSSKQISPIGNRLCQHVIGYSPSYIELPENIRKHLEIAEKERLENLKRADESCEVEECSDSEEANENENNHDDWPSIMDQSLIMSDDTMVRDFCKDNEISIVYFDRFECGEDS